ncbi:hypothetical protein HY991_02125 [Candidatus Micrarchaeota archaeon]|nr:hypothetical protein [Candidatus Micrarchaeota archaeon]
MRKGFLLTLDSLLALAILFSVFSVAVLLSSKPPEVGKYVALEALARDYLVITQGGVTDTEQLRNQFKDDTGSQVSTSSPLSGPLVVHSIYYKYSLICGGRTTLVYGTDACLNQQESIASSKHEAWVAP